jgi:hypothetical protein
MAAKTDQVIILPSDSGNTGKKVRAKESTVGANTVVEYFFIPSTERAETGRYKGSVLPAALPIAVQTGTTTGMLYLVNPVASTVKVAVSRINMVHNFFALAVDLVPPQLRVSKFTFTGTLSAALTTAAKRSTNDAAAQAQLAIAMTGLTITLVATIIEYLGMTMDLVTGGAGHWIPREDNWSPDEEGDEIILLPGEGIVIWSAIALTTANRRLVANVAWKEYT